MAVTPRGHAWAVGDRGTRPVSLILHWNGTRWRQVPSPSPVRGSRLWGVAAASASSAWAVGCAACAHAQKTLIVHWNGSAWRRVPSPSPAGGASLYAVTTGAGGTAWAVGSYRHSGRREPLIVRWTGRPGRRRRLGRQRLGRGLHGLPGRESGRADLALERHCLDTLCQPGQGRLVHRRRRAARRCMGGRRRGHRLPSCAPAADPALDRDNVAAGAVPQTPGGHQPVRPGRRLRARNAWAVGETGSFFNPQPRPIALQWDGTAWR